MQEKELQRPRVSIVLPVCPGDKGLVSTLDSLLAQRFRDYELLIIDDLSLGEELARIQAYARRDPRVRVLRGDFGDRAAAFNAGSSEALGEYLAYARPGDIWLPEKLARQIRLLECSPAQVGLVYTWSAELDEAGALTGRYCAGEERGDVYARLVYEDFIGGPSAVLLRRSCLRQVGGWRSEQGGEAERGLPPFFEFLLRFAELYSVDVVAQFLVGLRREPAAEHENLLRANRRILRLVGARHPGLPAALFRWARGRRFVELSERCEASGADARACWYLLCAAVQDAGLLALTEFRAAVGRQGGRAAERFLRRRPAKAGSAAPQQSAAPAPEQLQALSGHRHWLQSWRQARLSAAGRLPLHAAKGAGEATLGTRHFPAERITPRPHS